jgi:hypothetical protein
MISGDHAGLTFNMTIRKNVAALAVAGAVVLGAGGAVAWAQTTGGSTTTPSAASTDVPARLIRPLARRAVHGDIVVKDKDGNYVTVTFDRGSVAAASATSVTLTRPDGPAVTVTVTADTKVHGAATAADLKIGQDAIVVSRAGTATQIVQRPNA